MRGYWILFLISIPSAAVSALTRSSRPTSISPGSDVETAVKAQTDGLATVQHSGRIIELEVDEQVTISCVQRKSKMTNPGGCSFNLDTHSPNYPPHFIDTGLRVVQPVLQDKTRWIHLSSGQQVTVACPGNGNYLEATSRQVDSAICTAGKLRVDGRDFTYRNLGCHGQPTESFKETGTCLIGTTVEIGWKVGDDLINLMTICHVKNNSNTLYAINTINGASIEADDESNKRPSFRKVNYFTGIDIDKAYSQNGQMATLTKILGSATQAAKYINVSKNYYFARGHLAPDGDFIDAASQDATYLYINVLPQWQSFNNGNWKALETAVRKLASGRLINLSTYTGGFGTLTLADSKGVQKQIYLAFDVNNNGLVPVPKYFWKIVHDPVSNRAVAFVGINNPHLTTVPPTDIICPDICHEIPWVKWNRQNVQSGYMFCCTVAELNRAVPFCPKLGKLDLLV